MTGSSTNHIFSESLHIELSKNVLTRSIPCPGGKQARPERGTSSITIKIEMLWISKADKTVVHYCMIDFVFLSHNVAMTTMYSLHVKEMKKSKKILLLSKITIIQCYCRVQGVYSENFIQIHQKLSKCMAIEF